MAGVCHVLSAPAIVRHAAIAPATVAISAAHEAPSRAGAALTIDDGGANA
ncbi:MULTISPECIES: hypothetical protein [Mesorhizobium]|nr:MULTISPECIES: hypothetical protein [Mesorhizobium]WJI40547.1 hypothetical protein NL534_09995 [Mesorhizobium opportunistum]